MPLLLSDFVEAPSDASLFARPQGSAAFQGDACLVCGPPRSGKTVCLTRFACARARRAGAEETNAWVALLAPKGAALDCGAGRTNDESPDESDCVADTQALSRVLVKYLADDEELRHWCAALHLAVDRPPPSAIVVDGLGALLRGNGGGNSGFEQDKPLARTLAALSAAQRHCAEDRRRRGLGPCALVVSELSGRDNHPDKLYVYQRWAPAVLVLRPHPQGGGSAVHVVATDHEPDPLQGASVGVVTPDGGLEGGQGGPSTERVV